MSSYSTNSKFSDNRSRPASYAFPAFHSSLPYALVRDFAYPIAHPWHYGPPPETSEGPSGNSTPMSERQRRLSDPPNGTWEGSNSQWSAGPWGGDGFFSNQQLPQMAYGDGPPYSEDEDLHSPVVKSSRHRKNRSAFPDINPRGGRGRGRSPGEGFEGAEDDDVIPASLGQRSYFAGTDSDVTETYYIGEEDESANGPGGELVTYPPDQARQPLLPPNTYADPRFAARQPNRSRGEDESESESLGVPEQASDSRYSKDYQFTIASPDEEMHGKAVALFDFARENENELPLTEGQVIWVSYRHGQGWLVAEDPKTGDAGLVPEEYVRLLRDIEGGWSSLSGEQPMEEGDSESPVTVPEKSAVAPTQADPLHMHSAQNSNGSNISLEKRPPVVSSFSTSSKDLDPIPHHLLGPQAGHKPPQVVHYGSQTSTPTIRSPAVGVHSTKRGLEGLKGTEEEEEKEESTDSDSEKASR